MGNPTFPNLATGNTMPRPAKTSTSAGQVVVAGEEISVTAAQAGAVGTLLGSVKVPKNAVITGVKIDCDDLDSNGAPTIALSIGDAASDARLLASNTLAQAGGFSNTLAKGALGYQYTAETTVQVKVKTAAATGQAGTLRYAVEFVVP